MRKSYDIQMGTSSAPMLLLLLPTVGCADGGGNIGDDG